MYSVTDEFLRRSNVLHYKWNSGSLADILRVIEELNSQIRVGRVFVEVTHSVDGKPLTR